MSQCSENHEFPLILFTKRHKQKSKEQLFWADLVAISINLSNHWPDITYTQCVRMARCYINFSNRIEFTIWLITAFYIQTDLYSARLAAGNIDIYIKINIHIM